MRKKNETVYHYTVGLAQRLTEEKKYIYQKNKIKIPKNIKPLKKQQQQLESLNIIDFSGWRYQRVILKIKKEKGRKKTIKWPKQP